MMASNDFRINTDNDFKCRISALKTYTEITESDMAQILKFAVYIYYMR